MVNLYYNLEFYNDNSWNFQADLTMLSSLKANLNNLMRKFDELKSSFDEFYNEDQNLTSVYKSDLNRNLSKKNTTLGSVDTTLQNFIEHLKSIYNILDNDELNYYGYLDNMNYLKQQGVQL